jgi:hypothetical protein
LQRFRAVRQEIALEGNLHARPRSALSHSWTDTIFGFTEGENLATPGPPPAPSRRERSDCTIFADQWCDEAESTLDVAELDECTTRRKNQFRVRREPNHVISRDRQAIARIKQRSIHIAEQRNSRQPISL